MPTVKNVLDCFSQSQTFQIAVNHGRTISRIIPKEKVPSDFMDCEIDCDGCTVLGNTVILDFMYDFKAARKICLNWNILSSEELQLMFEYC